MHAAPSLCLPGILSIGYTLFGLEWFIYVLLFNPVNYHDSCFMEKELKFKAVESW